MNNNTKWEKKLEWGIYESKWGRNLEEVKVFFLCKKTDVKLIYKQSHFLLKNLDWLVLFIYSYLYIIQNIKWIKTNQPQIWLNNILTASEFSKPLLQSSFHNILL